MRRIIFLDSGPLGMVCHASAKGEALAIQNWVLTESPVGSEVVIAEIVDYEVRRKLIERGLKASLARLNDLHPTLAFYLRINTEAMRRAAELWAQARRGGVSTAGDESIDGDVILSAQALGYCSNADDWWVVTGNERHLARLLGNRARSWRNVPTRPQ